MVKYLNIVDHKDQRAGEIDVLVIFANRAIILQAKSKRLTLESRKGNDNCIKDDFKKSIQNSYEQGLSCAKLLTDKNYKLIDANSNEINISRDLKEIYIFCVVSDHYPALSFQARQFLQWQQTSNIKPPFIMDIFLFDVMVEMLQSPLHFLSYINKRTQYLEKIYVTKELIILSYHLKQNLLIDNKYDFIQLSDDICADLDVSMLVRREGIPGESTPPGILTRLKNTAIGNLIQEIEKLEDPLTVDLGFMLLTLSEDTMLEISKGLEAIASLAREDKKAHDVTFGIRVGSTGLTLHCNNDPMHIASAKLQGHCEMRKHAEKANNWFGICITPENKSLRFGLKLDYQWEASKEMDALVKNLPKGQKNLSFGKVKNRKKIGRNELCPCGNNAKFKKCCL